MAKKIVLVYPGFTEAHKTKIREMAAAEGYEAHFYRSNKEAYEDLLDAEIVFGMGGDLVERSPEIRWFAACSAGIDTVLAPGVIKNEDMLLTYSSGAYGVAIAEHAVMMTLELLRKQLTFNQTVAAHKWDRSPLFQGIVNARVTILGTGDLGFEIAKRFRAFEPMKIKGVNKRGANPAPAYFDAIVTQDDVDSVLPETDILLMVLPETAETRGFMNAKRLALLPHNAILVNLGRGSAVDEDALLDALANDKLAGAGLDVFASEPLPADSPLWDCKNLLITPHVAGNASLAYTVEKVVSMFITNLEHYFKGEALEYTVDRQRGY